jgi:hypothetical protein
MICCHENCHIAKKYQFEVVTLSILMQGRLKRWRSQLDLGNTTGGLETVVSVHNST